MRIRKTPAQIKICIVDLERSDFRGVPKDAIPLYLVLTDCPERTLDLRKVSKMAGLKEAEIVAYLSALEKAGLIKVEPLDAAAKAYFDEGCVALQAPR